MAKKSGLGRGLDSIFSENSAESNEAVTLRLSEIEPNKNQPRKQFDEAALGELAASIEKHGLIQPLLVRPMQSGRYQIVAGERRWRACRMAGLESVPVVIRDMDDNKVMELALIENLQREDLNPIEEAEGYKTLMDTFGFTQEQVAESVGKSRPAVANMLRLLGLKEEERQCLIAGKITGGHARALLAIADDDRRKEALELALQGATVRKIEQMATSGGKKQAKRQSNKAYSEVALALSTALGRRVKISESGAGGTLHLEFYSQDELFEYARRISGEK